MLTEITKLQSLYDDLTAFLSTYNIELDPPSRSNFNLRVKDLKSVKVACIMDEFTLLSYAPECQLLEITPNNWKDEIESFSPDMLFIESAWQGKDGLWYRKIANGSQELYALIEFCKEANIPVVYWGKEDPLYTQTFMSVASLADFVFTTDIDAVQAYKIGTNNPHVYHLHFAAQPIRHNPIEKLERKDSFCFAGSYYHRQVERSLLFDSFADYFIDTRGLEIYDRNYGGYGYSMPEYAFPEKYEPYILGRLPSEEIDKAYKGYFFGINMNTITQSQTMFARRVFELMASNTVVVGNFSNGVRNYFGDLTICTDDVDTLKSALHKYCGDSTTLQKYRLKALRKVLSEHLYEDRLAYIVEKVFGENIKPSLPKVAVLSHTSTEEAEAYVRAAFERQTYKNKVLCFSNGEIDESFANYVAFFSSEDYYGANYLLDMVLATRYLSGDVDGISKGIDRSYSFVDSIVSRSSMIKTKLALSLTDIGSNNPISGNFFAIDSFNYMQDYQEASCADVDDIHTLYDGLELENIQNIVENMPLPDSDAETIKLPASDAALLFNPSTRRLKANLKDGILKINVNVSKDKFEYLYFPNTYQLHVLKGAYNKEQFICAFEASQTERMELVIVLYDKDENRLPAKYIASGCSKSFPFTDEILSKAISFRVALRFNGKGIAYFSSITLGKSSFGPIQLLKNDTLILSDTYPSYENLYNNMFVHIRVKAYQQKGYHFDVICSNIHSKDKYREFDGVHVIDSCSQILSNVMQSEKIKTICVHSLNEHLFAALEPYLENIRVVIWVHGAEIQPWWRREYNYSDEKELEQKKVASEKRMFFWNHVFESAKRHDIHFVFVSQYFANEVMEDYKIELPKGSYSIIHNMIDTETFDYVEKDVSQRKKIFSCRPYTSEVYANDPSVKAIQSLSKHKDFEGMHFHIAGSGKLFRETVAPLRKYKNVTLEERFYTHSEIAALHKEYGVCLIPSRSDTQGVSRDEAMASGLVPVTNAVAAIPEFVNEQCGVLVPAEDWQALADGILKLYQDPELFKRLSAHAATRVREQSKTERIIESELELIEGA